MRARRVRPSVRVARGASAGAPPPLIIRSRRIRASSAVGPAPSLVPRGRGSLGEGPVSISHSTPSSVARTERAVVAQLVVRRHQLFAAHHSLDALRELAVAHRISSSAGGAVGRQRVERAREARSRRRCGRSRRARRARRRRRCSFASSVSRNSRRHGRAVRASAEHARSTRAREPQPLLEQRQQDRRRLARRAVRNDSSARSRRYHDSSHRHSTSSESASSSRAHSRLAHVLALPASAARVERVERPALAVLVIRSCRLLALAPTASSRVHNSSSSRAIPSRCAR